MRNADRARDFTTPREIRDWRSAEIARIKRTLAEKVRVLRLELKDEAASMPRLDLVRPDARLFGGFVRKRMKPELDAAAEGLLDAAGRDLLEGTAGIRAADGEADGPGSVADRLATFSLAPQVALPALGVGIGLYVVFAMAFTTVSSWVVFRHTDVSPLWVLAGVALVAISTVLFLTLPSRVRARKQAALLRRFDAYVDREVTAQDLAAAGASLESRLVTAIRGRAAELEAGLEDV